MTNFTVYTRWAYSRRTRERKIVSDCLTKITFPFVVVVVHRKSGRTLFRTRFSSKFLRKRSYADDDDDIPFRPIIKLTNRAAV